MINLRQSPPAPSGERTEAPLTRKWHLVAALMERGALLRPAARINYFFNGHSCAAGALYEGMGGQYDERWPQPMMENRLVDMVKSKTGVDLDSIVPLPCGITYCDMKNMRVLQIIYVLNDQYGWSRERIAQWLRTLDS